MTTLYFLQAITLPGGNALTGQVPFSNLGAAVSALLPIIFSLAGMAAFIFLLIGSSKYLASGGDEKALMSAKSTITASLVGFVIVFLAYWVIKIVEGSLGISIFGSLTQPVYAADTRIQDRFAPNAMGAAQFNSLTIGDFINKFLPAVFAITFIAFFLFFLFGAISFMTSGGDEKAKAAAKQKITSAFIGLLFVLLSYWIIRVFEIIVAGQSTTLF